MTLVNVQFIFFKKYLYFSNDLFPFHSTFFVLSTSIIGALKNVKVDVITLFYKNK